MKKAPPACTCKIRRRSDCRQGSACPALTVRLHSSPRPAQAAARWVIGLGIAVGLAIVAFALRGGHGR